jgi:alpha-tubulin suppressor-like RCC1 family protein
LFGSATLIDKLNALISSGGLNEIELAQAWGVIDSIERHGMHSVRTSADLPAADQNLGRFVWIESENRYVVSNGVVWDINSIFVVIPVNAWAWGYNNYGRLGDNTVTSRLSPVSVVGGFSDWTGISAGGFHSLGTRADGSAWAWGGNGQGRLGDGTITTRSSPVSVVGGFSDWTGVSAGGGHSLGTRADGTVWAWGSNDSGRLGDGTATARSSPVSVVGGFSDWTGVSAGDSHSLGTRADGSAWAWGLNTTGRLGDGTITARSSPVSVVGGFADWTGVSAGGYHSLGTRANGSAWAWGFGSSGRLGNNTTTARGSPVSVVGGFADWTGVSAGGSHSLGTRANGSAWAWGSNASGQLGDNTVTSRLSPVSVVGGFSDWTGVSAGNFHSLATRANGSAWAWGYNVQGRLGDGTITSRRSPVSVVGGFSDWAALSAGNSHSLGVRA